MSSFHIALSCSSFHIALSCIAVFYCINERYMKLDRDSAQALNEGKPRYTSVLQTEISGSKRVCH